MFRILQCPGSAADPPKGQRQRFSGSLVAFVLRQLELTHIHSAPLDVAFDWVNDFDAGSARLSVALDVEPLNLWESVRHINTKKKWVEVDRFDASHLPVLPC